MNDPLTDLDAYIALPRLSGLAISPDGSRLVTTVAQLSPDRTRYTTSLWQVDPSGGAPPRRLTRSLKGESTPAFPARLGRMGRGALHRPADPHRRRRRPG